MRYRFVGLVASIVICGAAQAQPSVTLYGRVDLSLAQSADAPSSKEIRNGSNSRIGVRGSEDLGGGLKAVFHLEHRFNADDGTQQSVRFWEGKSIVGLEGRFGRVSLGREENPAFTYGQVVADPWGMDTVASNATIVNGRIGSTRYSNTVNYRFTSDSYAFGAQFAEADGNTPIGGSADRRPYSLGFAYTGSSPWFLSFGYENPADADDHWGTVTGAYNFGVARLGAFFGSGKSVSAQKVQAYLFSLTAPVAGGELRASYGQLKNKDAASNGVLDKQFGVGYHYRLSQRSTVYADLVNERRAGVPEGWRKTGYDLGLKHNF
jgi:predicted porin